MEKWLKQVKSYIEKQTLIAKISGLLAAIFLLVIVSWFLLSRTDPLEEKTGTVSDISQVPEGVEQAKPQQVAQKRRSGMQLLMVDIKGAVKRPGVYDFKQKEVRLRDVLEAAGGIEATADTRGVNFAAKIADETLIYIPFQGEELPEAAGQVATTNTSGASGASGKININQADVTELQKIPGIGQKRAEDIFRYREENGKFKTIEDLQNVSGIGKKTLEKLAETIIT